MSKVILKNTENFFFAENRPPQNRTIMRSYITNKWDQQNIPVIPKFGLIKATLFRGLTE